MEQLGLMKMGPTSILREQGGEITPEIPKKPKILLLWSISSLVVQKNQLDEWDNMVWGKMVRLQF